MKVVIDTNVLLSSFLTEGLVKKVFDLCIDNDDIYFSEWIFNELKSKLSKKFLVPENEIESLIGFLKSISYLVEPKGILSKISRDEKDDPILLLAEFVKADYIITGDKDLLELLNYKNTKIVNSRTYYEIYRQAG